jgi:group I intron endonuclease
MYSIYLVKNKINGKVYVGKTQLSPEARFRQHCRDAFGKRAYYFQKAIKKYGADNFEITLLDVCDTSDKANKSEVYYIAKYDSKNNEIGYNLTNGGDGVAGRKKSEAEIEAIRQWMLERSAIISKANSGKNNGNYGKPEPMSSRIAKGKKISETKLTKPSRHIKLSDETKNKLRSISLNRLSEKISDDIKDEIVVAYKTGKFVKRDLSEKYQIPLSSIQQILRYWETVRINKLTRPTNEQKDQIIKLRSDGHEYSEISDIVGVPEVKVRNIWKVHKRKVNQLAILGH